MDTLRFVDVCFDDRGRPACVGFDVADTDDPSGVSPMCTIFQLGEREIDGTGGTVDFAVVDIRRV